MGPEPLTKHQVPALENMRVGGSRRATAVAPAPFEIRSRRDPLRERRTGCAAGCARATRRRCTVPSAGLQQPGGSRSQLERSVPPRRQTTHINEPIQQSHPLANGTSRCTRRSSVRCNVRSGGSRQFNVHFDAVGPGEREPLGILTRGRIELDVKVHPRITAGTTAARTSKAIVAAEVVCCLPVRHPSVQAAVCEEAILLLAVEVGSVPGPLRWRALPAEDATCPYGQTST